MSTCSLFLDPLCCLQGDSWMWHLSAVRTPEIDQQLQAAVQDSPIRQMLLLGELSATLQCSVVQRAGAIVQTLSLACDPGRMRS
jgi:hypothetical protein